MVLHSGDWESLSRVQLPSGPLTNLTKALNSLILNINSSNAHLMKKVYFILDLYTFILVMILISMDLFDSYVFYLIERMPYFRKKKIIIIYTML